MKRSFKIWAVAGGPYSREQLEDDYYEEEYSEFPEEGNFLLLCNVEENKRLREEEFWFSEKEDAYKFKNFVDSKMEAIEVVDEGIMNYADSGKMC